MRQGRSLKVRTWALISMGVGALAWLALTMDLWPLHPGPYVLALGALATLAALIAALRAWRDFADQRGRNRVLIDAAEHISRGDFSHSLEPGGGNADTDVKQAFERMRVTLRETTYSRNYLHSVLNSMADAVFVVGPDCSIRMANEAAQRLTGYDEAQLLGMNLRQLLYHADDVEGDALKLAREAGEAVLRNSTGQTIPVSLAASSITHVEPAYTGEIYVARDITERKRAERRIRYLARYDALTKIPNRMQFQHLLQQSIARARRTGQNVAMLYIDMDRFKEVNDTFGHASGDRVLEVLTERLTRALPPEAVLGRLAGDEFAIFVDGYDDTDGAGRARILQLASSVIDTAGSAFHINQHEVFLSVSVGVAFCPDDADNVIDLIRNADAAMYYAKQNGGNSFAAYSQDMNAAAVERLMLKSKLRRALERDEFYVHYQPKVDLSDGRIMGAEALLRWRVPGHGDILPSQFVPLAEENNLIEAIGEWVLERVCQDFAQIRRYISSPGRIALNLSLKQLRQASFILKCHDVFERHRVAPQHIELEITETTLMADPKRTVQLLDQLAAMGIHLSIDDFGTGYSSLSALQQFPIGSLKIDQTFVRDVAVDPADATLVRTIIDMGHGLGLEVVAEGVETEEQLEFVRASHCNYAQGRLFGEAVAIDVFVAQLRAQHDGKPPFADLISSVAARSAEERIVS
jgi:diguanylate cyclase (GGDEF)-like protein/PAS domain S-box-containing protein